ncbi:hypothetical protein GIB67_034385 [Kingdonia uniflora]|uniref:MD-2-related lipid-recognition domain-containing protein n=1 Tax=Kingdonia uniflora TaxID=39325 RepID=A0A7J7NSC2_9MAGN|nr:hypothetical protein GIB67_034385 [Kingdonia uniflora]
MATIKIDLILTLCFVAFLLAPPIQARKITYCDKKNNYAIKVKDVVISPDPVTRGKPTTFSIYASASESFSGGRVVIDVYYIGINVHTEKIDLCNETSCPVSSGDFVLSHVQTLPGITPPGSYTLKLRMEDGEGKQMTCVSFGFSIGGWWLPTSDM